MLDSTRSNVNGMLNNYNDIEEKIKRHSDKMTVVFVPFYVIDKDRWGMVY